MFDHLCKTQKGMALAFLGFSSFAFGDVCVKWLTKTYATPQVIFLDHGFAALFLLCALPFLGGMRALTHMHHKPLHGLRALINVAIALIITTSYALLPLADVYALLFTFPLFSALLAIPMYKQSVCPKSWIAIIVGFTGVLIALRPLGDGLNTGMILPLLSSVLIALLFLISRKMENESVFSLGFWPVFGTMLAMVPPTFMHFQTVDLQSLLIFILGGFFIAVGMTCVSLAFRMTKAALISPLQYTEIIWAVLFGFLIFGDVPNPWTLIGAGIIIISGLALLRVKGEAE